MASPDDLTFQGKVYVGLMSSFLFCLANVLPLYSFCSFPEFEEAAVLLSSNPGAATLSISGPGPGPGAAASSGDVRVDLSDDEDNQQENSEVMRLQTADHFTCTLVWGSLL